MKTLLLASAALMAASAAHAQTTTKDFTYSAFGSPVATGAFSYASTDTGVLGFGDLSSFSLNIGGDHYSLADVLALTDYVHFAYDTSTNEFDVDPNTCGFDGCGFSSGLSAINSNGTSGFFFNGAPGDYVDYKTQIGGSFDTLTITGGAVPEPATWAMMLVGFGMVGFGLRYTRKQSVRVTFA